MISLRNAAFAAIAFACLASPALAQNREPVTARVRYADLNLTTAAGRAELKARIRGASTLACPEMGGSLPEKIDAARCRGEMMRDGELQIARLNATADQQLALADHR